MLEYSNEGERKANIHLYSSNSIDYPFIIIEHFFILILELDFEYHFQKNLISNYYLVIHPYLLLISFLISSNLEMYLVDFYFIVA
jgi:hypothetical protein